MVFDNEMHFVNLRYIGRPTKEIKLKFFAKNSHYKISQK